MASWKLPSKAKIYEALTALADGRVRLTGPTEAEVTSSGRDRTYTVRWSPDGRLFSSNDNASHWQGVLGYPIVAVLLALNRLPWDRAIATRLAGIAWKHLNDRFRRDYEAAVRSVLDDLEAQGLNRAAVEREVDRIYDALCALPIERGPRLAPASRRLRASSTQNE